MQRGLYESPDVQAAIQQAIMQGINPGVLRGIEGGTLHFVTVQRSGDQEYIDHSLLNPEYITAQIQNGMLINMVPATPDQIAQYEQLPELVNQHDETIEETGNRYVEVNNHQPPQYIEQKQVIQDQLGPTDGNSMSIPQNDNELVTYIQCVPHTGQHMVQTNEAQVIVSNKQNNQVPPLSLLTRSQPKRSVKVPFGSSNVPVESDMQNLYTHPSDSECESDSAGGLGTHQPRRSRGRPKKLVNLPHKKRISNKLKDGPQTKKKATKKSPPRQLQLTDEPQKQQLLNPDQNNCESESVNVREYVCEECEHRSYSQFNFYLHLKLHYEPNDVTNGECANNQVISATITQNEMTKPLNNDDDIEEYEVAQDAQDLHDDSSRESKYTIMSPVKKQQDVKPAPELEQHNEFSDNEDMLEGIRGTVDQLQQSVDNDINHEAAANWFKNEPTNTIEHKPNTAYIITTDQRQQEDLELINVTGILRHHLMNRKTNTPEEIILMSVDAIESPEKKYAAVGTNSEVNVKKTKKIPRTVASQMNDYIEESDLVSSDDETDSKSKKKRKSFKCRICEKVCNSKNSLHYHFLSHTGERPHMCDICGKGFFAAGALKVHNRLHSGAKPYSCDVCGRAFRQWGDLKYHIVSLHTEAKQHQCEFCGKEFSRRYSLVLHRRIHTGERNYKCEFCDKTFRASSYLQDHRRIHTGEKPHPCEICGKKFRIRSDLKRHKNIHTRATPGRITKVTKSKLKNVAAVMNDVVLENSSDGMLIKIEMEQRDGLTVRDEPVSYVTNTTRP